MKVYIRHGQPLLGSGPHVTNIIIIMLAVLLKKKKKKNVIFFFFFFFFFSMYCNSFPSRGPYALTSVL